MGIYMLRTKVNHRVQVLDKNGTFIKKFGENGTAPGQLNNPYDLIFLPDGRLIVGDESYLNYFDSNGTFITRTNSSSARTYVSLAPDGSIWSYQRLRDSEGSQIVYQSTVNQNSRTAFTPEGDLIESGNNKLRLWKRAYRTKGLVNRNVIPQPAIRGVTQRAGTNIIDLDFEIIDPDDANATAGILAAQDGAFINTSKWILPQSWVDGTASKIGTPIATNQVHRVSWNVKPDWPDNTGTLKFEIICHDARRTAPVDLHFLTLPLPDGNLTISRSPLKDSDFESYAKFLLTTGQAELNATSNEVQFPPVTVPSGDFVFTSAGKTGKDGPTSAEVNASYIGTPLEGNVTMTTQGIQEWTVPETGVYSIEAAGARGGWGHGQSSKPGYGARMIGKFNLTVGDVLKIVVGQEGISGGNYYGGGGGGGSFVWITGASNPLIIGGGGGGGAGDSHGRNRHATDASTSENGLPSYSGNPGGVNGSHGSDSTDSKSFGGTGWNSSSPNLKGGQKFLGGDHSRDGGFGGGGGSNNYGGGGGGGFSGGAGENHDKNSQRVRGTGGGAGSFNSASEKIALVNESKNGFVRIRKIQANTPLVPTILSTLLYDDRWSSGSLRFKLEQALGTGYRLCHPRGGPKG